MNIMKSSYAVIKSSDYERVKTIYNERNASKRAMQDDYDRGFNMWKIYMGFYGEQWPETKLALLTADKRYPYQFNIVRPKIDTMAGVLITDLPDPDWVPVEGQPTTGTEAIKDTFYTDKETTNWRPNLIQLIQAALVHDGWIEMIEDTKHHPLGNIGLVYQRSGSFVPSSYWKSNSDRDLQKGWKSRYFNAEQLAFKYEKSSSAIKAAIEDIRLHGSEELPSMEQAARDRRNFSGNVGNEHEVIEEMWLETVKTERLYGRKAGELITIPFPVTIKEAGPEFEQFVAINEIEIDTIKPMPYQDIVCHKTAIAPSLDPTIILYDKKTRVQVKGLPMYHLTTRRHEGRNMGLVETVKDLQTVFNERMSLDNEILAKVNGGMTIWNSELTKDPKVKKRINQNHNRPGHNEHLPIDDVKQVSHKVEPPTYPSHLMSQIDLLHKELLPVIIGVSDAWSAESRSGQSGILFEREIQMNKIGTLLQDEGVKQLMNNIGEGYLYQWPITYGDSEREIKSKDGKNKVVLNQKMEDGSIKNSVAHTPRTRVVVTEKTNTPTKNSATRQMVTEFRATINPEMSPITYQNSNKMFFKTLESLPDEEKEEYLADIELEKASAKTQVVAAIANNTAATSAAVVQDKQAQGAIGQMGGAPPQGQPQEQVTSPEEQINQAPPEEEEESILTASNTEI